MNIEENDFRTPIVAAGDKIGYVHIGENHRGYLGSGHVNFPQLFAALVEIGYKGTITFESFSSAVVDEDLSKHPAHLAQRLDGRHGPRQAGSRVHRRPDGGGRPGLITDRRRQDLPDTTKRRGPWWAPRRSWFRVVRPSSEDAGPSSPP